jgi:hypothetical protein
VDSGRIDLGRWRLERWSGLILGSGLGHSGRRVREVGGAVALKTGGEGHENHSVFIKTD